jgi:hypothetical protein
MSQKCEEPKTLVDDAKAPDLNVAWVRHNASHDAGSGTLGARVTRGPGVN